MNDKLTKLIEDNLAKVVGETETQRKINSVIIPVIRNWSSKIIAEDIVGVQPMISPTSIQIGFTDGIEHPYWAEPIVSPGSIFNYSKFDGIHREQIDWCLETFSDEDWVASSFKFYFRNEKDRDWFVLRWS